MKDSLFLKVLELILEEIPSGRSLVLLSGEVGGLRARLSRGIDWEADHGVCRDIVGRAIESGQPLLIRDFGAHPLFRGHPSVREKGLASALCLPLLAGGRAGGAFYMDRTAAEPPFNAGDLELLAAAAGFLNHILASTLRCPPAGGGNGNGRMPLLVGQDARFLRVRVLVDRVKNSGAPVFISGESGTGKELVARTIHETGSRKSGKFVAVNCGAIPDNLLESELFGYARGAFTGAARDKVGLIEDADGGTFFLDEIGDLTFPLQAKLLRVLEDGAIRRLGETRIRTVDVRWVSATHKDLDKEVREARFREDLYYRLKIIPIELPPLRERTDDLLPLINHFAERYAREMRRPRPYFSPGALEMLFHYPWPGNVRELQNEVQRSFIMAGENNLIREEFLSPKINPRKETYSDDSRRLCGARSEFEKRFLREALARCGYRRTRTATEIGITRQGLFKLMKKHRIEIP
jgi:DNA-binding NtrC family response regulator